MELTEHLFRHEWGRMVGAVTRIFGVHNLALAEDHPPRFFSGTTRRCAWKSWSFVSRLSPQRFHHGASIEPPETQISAAVYESLYCNEQGGRCCLFWVLESRE